MVSGFIGKSKHKKLNLNSLIGCTSHYKHDEKHFGTTISFYLAYTWIRGIMLMLLIYLLIILSRTGKLRARVHLSKTWLKIQTLLPSVAAPSIQLNDSNAEAVDEDDDLELYLKQTGESKLVEPSATNVSSLTDKFEKFENQPCLNRKLSVLQYWETKKLIAPEMYELSKVVLAVPATQVSVQKAFSSLKFLFSPLCSTMSQAML